MLLKLAIRIDNYNFKKLDSAILTVRIQTCVNSYRFTPWTNHNITLPSF